jgi:hypothetical protein
MFNYTINNIINNKIKTLNTQMSNINQQVKAIKVVTQSEYDALGTEKNTDNTLYLIRE